MRRTLWILLLGLGGYMSCPVRAQEVTSLEGVPVIGEEVFGKTGSAEVQSKNDSDESLRSQITQLRKDVDTLQKASEKQAHDALAKPSSRISLELQLDTYAFSQDAANRASVGDIEDGTAFRRARIAWLGSYSITDYRLEFDFAQPGRPTFLDVWASVGELPVLGQIKVGHFFEPLGLDRMTSNRYSTFMERSFVDQAFFPGRNPGIQISNRSENDRMTWAIGYFRSHIDNFGDAVGDEGDRAITGRVTGLPWYDEESGGRGYLHLGFGASYRSTLAHRALFRVQPEARLGAADVNVPFFLSTGIIHANSFQTYDFELAYCWNSLYVQSEFAFTPVDQTSGDTATLFGYYATVGYFLTGEHRPYRKETASFDRVQPFEEFFRVRSTNGVVTGMGAWEIAARVSHLNFDATGINAGKLTDLTLGLNWYLNPYTRVTSDYVHPFLTNGQGVRSGANIFGVRVQYEY